jgi:D-glycero-alpha-D-manno-heptose-7-phosphate kinase
MDVVAHAPVRVADVGGWSDTWFAEHGVVCNVAVGPGVSVTIREIDGPYSTFELENFGERCMLDDAGAAWLAQHHPILARCLDTHLGSQRSTRSVNISIASLVPAGSSLGTSAAVGVALTAALIALGQADGCDVVNQQRVAESAHRAETESGLQSGVQDHAAAAHGGISRIEIAYPRFVVERLVVPEATLTELDRRLFTMYLGRPHDSSALHQMVIARLEATGSGAVELNALRELGDQAADALVRGDLRAYGKTFDRCVEAQRALHPDLISGEAQQIGAVASRFGASIKVNGAGGPGGSVTVLGPADEHDLAMLKAELLAISGVGVLDLRLWADGVVVTRPR